MSILFEPVEIGTLKLKNRFVRSATVECLASEDGRVTEAYLEAYERLARGRVGLIVPGNYYVNPMGRAYPKTITVDRDDCIPDLRRVTEVVHAHGARIVGQINHGGREADPRLIPGRPLGPSPVRDKLTFVKPREMTEAEIEETIGDFARAARRLMEAGFDGIQIHAAHGYLVNQFLSPYTNRRRDRWGGSPENRMRFLLEIYRRVRSEVGRETPVLTKINAEDFVARGVHLEACVATCKRLAEAGIDAIEVSGGIPEKGLVTIKGDLPRDLFLRGRGLVERIGFRLVERSLRRAAAFEEGYFLPHAAEVKRHVPVPVIAVGGLRTRRTMEEAILRGKADLVSLCRPFIRQPALVRLMEQGKEDPITCTSCNRCSLEILLHHKPMKCYRS